MSVGRSSRASCKALRTVLGGDHLEALAREETPHQIAHGLLVVDDQHSVASAAAGRTRLAPRSRRLAGEGCAAAPAGSRIVNVVPRARRAFDRDVAAHQPASLRLIARPRPVPPYLRVVDASAWREFLEQPAELLGRHADAGVGAR